MSSKQDFQSKHKIVKIVWIDSASYSGWHSSQDILEIGEKPEVVITIGFLIKETKETYVIAHSTDEDVGYCGVLEIPKVCVKGKIEEIKK
jgi:hypothetical protein